MSRKALIVGLNHGGGGKDPAGVANARAMAKILAHHKDGEENFRCTVLLEGTDGPEVTQSNLQASLKGLFRAADEKDEVLLYFSGPGYLGKTGGLLCASDGVRNDWGIPLREVMTHAVQSPANHTLLLLDCCQCGDMAGQAIKDTKGSAPNALGTLRENMTVIGAARDAEQAIEPGGHSLFTQALLDALDGGAADHMGAVTAPAIYTWVSRRFPDTELRPVYKTNATDVLSVRRCEPLIERLKLQRLPALFPTIDHKYQLDSEHEPEDEYGNVKEPVNWEKVKIARLFKSYRDAGLLRSSDPKLQLFWVAKRNGTVELTPRGREYWWLLVNHKI
jgi:hypothetical protein